MKRQTETSEAASSKRWLVLGSVLTSRVIYTLNWFNIAPLLRAEEEGLVLGLYNSCFNIGGAIGLFGWVLVTDFLGWRGGLVLGGLIGVVSVLIGQVVIPRDKVIPRTQRRSITPVFRNRI